MNASLTLSLAAAPAAPVYGRPVTLTASLSFLAPAGLAAPSGQVTFALGGATPFVTPIPLGSAAVLSGSATLDVGALPVGTQVVVAQYSGDSTWPGLGGLAAVNVSRASAAATVAIAAPSGQLTLSGTATAAAPGAGTPTGSVQFVDAVTHAVVASGSLSGGKASAKIPASAAAMVLARPIAALYSGNDNFSGVTSAPLPAIVSAASWLTAAFAPDEIVSVFGVGGMSGDTVAAMPVTAALGGVTVNVLDAASISRPAPMYGVFGAAGQINCIVPSDTGAGLATVSILLPDGSASSNMIAVGSVAPGIFVANMTGQGPFAGQVVYGGADGSQTVTASAVWDTASQTYVANPVDLSAASQVYLVMYGSGLRHGTSLAATLNGIDLPVAYFGAQSQYPGLDQVNLGPLPASLAGTGAATIAITVDGQPANAVTTAFK